MKQLSRLLMLAALVIFVSCQNEKLTEDQSIEESALDNNENIIEPDDDFEASESDNGVIQFDGVTSEKLVTRSIKSPNTLAKGGNNSSCTPDIEGLVASLPTSVSARTTSKPGNDAYFDLEILDTNLAGADIPAWCADQDLSLGVEGPLNFDVYSSYGELPEGVFEKPENFDLVNWVLNQDFIGKDSPSGGTYTFGHVQYAIWLLVDDSVCQVCTYLTDPTGSWNNDSSNVTKAQEIADAALANGEGYMPGCGDKFGIILVPDGKQSLIITKEVEEEECSDCEGKVTDLSLEFDWHKAKRVKVYQKKENTCWAAKIFDQTVQPGETIDLSGINHDGTFGRYIYIYIGNNSCYYYTKIRTDCKLKIGPGYEKGVFNVVDGRSSEGGKLCEYVKPKYDCYRYRHWWTKYYSRVEI